METRSATTIFQNPFADKFTGSFSQGDSVNRRLEILLAANAEIDREKTLFRSDRERLEAAMMRTPLSLEKAFAYFGLLLGVFPPLTILVSMALNMGSGRKGTALVIILFTCVNALSAVTGYHTGKLIGRIVRNLESRSWTFMLPMSVLVGLFWGIMAGGAGGAIVFGIGAFFGAFLGAAVGAIALPTFLVFHRLLKRGEMIDLRHFLPLSFGITYSICALILGM